MNKSAIAPADAVLIMTEAQFDRLNSNNGFGKQRLTRTIGAIPPETFTDMLAEADACGDYLSGTDLKKYLNRNPQYRTVNALDTGHTGHIIVK